MSSLEDMVINLNPNNTDAKSVMNLNIKQNNDPVFNSKPSVNFGEGIELLMNEKKKSSSAEIGLGELSDLENELNDLSTDINTKSLESTRSNLFNSAINSISSGMNGESTRPTEINKSRASGNGNGANGGLGEATADAYADKKTWDGYGKFNNVPVSQPEDQISKEE